MIGKLLRRIADHATSGNALEKRTGLRKDHPLIRFYGTGGETAENYLALDDALVFGALEAMMRAEDFVVSDLALRLRGRSLYKTLDIADVGHDEGKQRQKRRKILKDFEAQLDNSVILDDKASISIYSEIGGDDDRTHKKLHVLDGGVPVEISVPSKMIEALERKTQFTRFYFESEEDRDKARGQNHD